MQSSRCGYATPILVLVAAASLLAFVASHADVHTVFIHGLDGAMNDQIVYISVARHLASGDGFKSGAIYPSTLTQKTTKDYFYMPGHFLALATSFRLLGYSALSAFLPNVIAFLVAALLVYFIGMKLYGRWTGAFAALLYILFPLNGVLAWSAMSELTLTAAALISFALFILLGEKWRPWFGPFLVVLPLLFRETGVLIAAPMCLLVLRPPGRDKGLRWRDASLFAAITTATCILVLSSPIAQGRPTLLLNNLAGESFESIYTDAYALETLDRSPAHLWQLIVAKFERNLDLLVAPWKPTVSLRQTLVRLVRVAGTSGEPFAMSFLIAGIPIAFVAYAFRRDWFAAGVAISLTTMLLLVLLLYTVWFYRGVRVLLVLQPFVGIVYASLCDALRDRWRWAPDTLAIVAVAILMFEQRTYTARVYADEKALNAADAWKAAFVETLKLDDRKTIVAPHDLILRYVLDHYPTSWSFMPANSRTMRLLREKYNIGAVIYPTGSSSPMIGLEELERDGFHTVRMADYGGSTILVLQPPPK